MRSVCVCGGGGACLEGCVIGGGRRGRGKGGVRKVKEGGGGGSRTAAGQPGGTGGRLSGLTCGGGVETTPWFGYEGARLIAPALWFAMICCNGTTIITCWTMLILARGPNLDFAPARAKLFLFLFYYF